MAAVLHPSLATAVGTFVADLAETRTAELRLRYRFGQVIHDVRYAPGGKYERGSLERLAAHLRVHPSALRTQARVVEAIGLGEFERMLTLRLPDGLPLPWSCFEKLASVRPAARRMGLAERIAKRGLPVRELAAMKRELTDPGATGTRSLRHDEKRSLNRM